MVVVGFLYLVIDSQITPRKDCPLTKNQITTTLANKIIPELPNLSFLFEESIKDACIVLCK